MDCAEVHQRLSPYIDGELSESQSTDVGRHLEACAPCHLLHLSYRRLGEMTRTAPVIVPTARVWEGITAALANEVESPQPQYVGWWGRRATLIAAAAALLMVVGVGVVAWRATRPDDPDKQLAAVFDRYLLAFSQSPLDSQQILDQAYPFTRVSANEPHPLVEGSRLASQDALPGMKRISVVIRKLPCCDCVQGLFQRDDGSYCTVFEHEMPSAWDANQPGQEVKCADCDCRLMQIDSQLAATWEHASRYFTVVGANNFAELEQIVSLLNPPASYDEG